VLLLSVVIVRLWLAVFGILLLTSVFATLFSDTVFGANFFFLFGFLLTGLGTGFFLVFLGTLCFGVTPDPLGWTVGIAACIFGVFSMVLDICFAFCYARERPAKRAGEGGAAQPATWPPPSESGAAPMELADVDEPRDEESTMGRFFSYFGLTHAPVQRSTSLAYTAASQSPARRHVSIQPELTPAPASPKEEGDFWSGVAGFFGGHK